ncbi:periplasmic nitrate reductase, NapE protein [Neisseria iguanae]|uniref:Nitrate reductase n=1 Tax=Neisseria iguanae TaxID=90242 RepID=A0A2P7U0F8_9NEIS|nr:hypothetical protein C7N83_06280 [Neisseria iguanae]
MDKQINLPVTAKSEWKRFLLLAFVALPVVALLLICTYGFIVWFGQILWWGLPK